MDVCDEINSRISKKYRSTHLNRNISDDKKMKPLSMLQSCRPNFVVDGGVPYAEDYWNFARIGNIELRPVRPCGRCVMTTVDQDTAKGRSGVLSLEPLKTLRKNRTMKDDRFGPVFGLYYNFVDAVRAAQHEQKIHVGDRFLVKSLCTSSVVHASDVARHYKEEEEMTKKCD